MEILQRFSAWHAKNSQGVQFGPIFTCIYASLQRRYCTYQMSRHFQRSLKRLSDWWEQLFGSENIRDRICKREPAAYIERVLRRSLPFFYQISPLLAHFFQAGYCYLQDARYTSRLQGVTESRYGLRQAGSTS